MRFRKSVKICKGVRINFSKSGASCTFGMPGLSVNVGKKGSYLNTGIPGTGLYNRRKISGGSNNYHRASPTQTTLPQTVNLKLNDDSTISFYDVNGNTITDASVLRKIKASPQFKMERERMMNEYYDKINSQTEKFINIHTLSPQVDNIVQYKKAIEQLKPEKYIKKEFTKQEPDKNSVYEELSGEAVRTVTSWKFWKLSSMRKQFIEDRIDDRFNDLHMAWEDEKRKHDERENEMEAKKNKFYLKKFEETKKSLQMALDGTGEYIEESANSWLSTVTLPLDFSLQFEYLDNILLVDLDLPEIEDIPQEKAARLANGTVKKKSKTQKDLKSDYLRCVFGLAVFFSANLFNISPAIKQIVISGYTQRRNPKTGDLQDDYIYSLKFLRDVFEVTNLYSIDPYDFCMQFENRCNITQTMLMKAITPFAC